MDELQIAINKTKDYAHKYGQILNDRQLFLRLISPKIFDFKKVEGGGEKVPQNNEWKRKMQKAKQFADRHLSKMSGIEMVGVTGSVAAETADKNEDIDLLVITKKDELWWWRLYLRFYIRWHNIPHRRFNEKERKDEFCFNLWLDRANLIIPKEKRNLKNATDLIMMKVILNKGECYQQFLLENNWVKKYLATGYQERAKNNREVDKKFNSENGNNFFKHFINRILFWGQYLYMRMKSKKKLKYIEIGQAFFHSDN